MGMLSLLIGLLSGFNVIRQENSYPGIIYTLWGGKKKKGGMEEGREKREGKGRDLRPELYLY